MKPVAVILIAFIVGLLVAYGGSQNGLVAGSWPVFLLCAILAYIVNWLAFIPAAIARSEKYYDLVGSLTYLSVITVACVLSAPLDARAMLVGAMVVIWSLRLGTFLFRRISADGKDIRFDTIKTKPLLFLQAWTLQGSWVTLTAASALAIITTSSPKEPDALLALGLAMWLIGFAFEVTADRQKARFRKNPENHGRFITSGLWAWCRHPNYFGEILLWAGITVISLPLLTGWQWVTVISPFFVAFLLTKVSGVPMLDRIAKKRWGDEQAYLDYRAKTPMLIPRPPKSEVQP